MMKLQNFLRCASFGLLGATLGLSICPMSALAQETTGAPGSPGTTTAIDGKQLPPLAPEFGGVIKQKAADSQPWWAPRVVPPKGAPNVLLIMTDDQGFGAPSTFGGVIPTPAMDRIDVGLDTRTGVALIEHRYDAPFKFTGKIDKLTIKLQ
jgi:hypothetical protein